MGRHTFGIAQCRLRSSSNLIAGGTNRHRYRVRAPSFINLTVLEGSVDIVMGEVGSLTRRLKRLQELQCYKGPETGCVEFFVTM